MFSVQSINPHRTHPSFQSNLFSSWNDSQTSQTSSPLFKSRYSRTSTNDSHELSTTKMEIDFIEMESDQTCLDFQRKGYCMKGRECRYFHQNRKPKWQRALQLEWCADMAMQGQTGRRKFFLF